MIHKLVSIIVSWLKGVRWAVDDRVPLGYLLKLVYSHFIMFSRGLIIFRDLKKTIFIGKYSTVRCKSLVFCKGMLKIGRYCNIDALSLNGISFGYNVSIGNNTNIECSGSFKDLGIGLTIGDNVGLGSHGFWGCAGGITVGENTIFGNFVSLHSENHNFSSLSIPIKDQGVSRIGISIGSNCWIGAKVTILDGVVIQDGCLLVKGVYSSDAIYGGVPAKFIKNR